MPNTSQSAVLSNTDLFPDKLEIAHILRKGWLALLLRAFYFNHLSAGIGATSRADTMGQLGAVALRAQVQCRYSHFQMTSPFTLACL